MWHWLFPKTQEQAPSISVVTGEEHVASLIIETFGYCEDENFTVSCAGCLASHLVRILRDEPTPVAEGVLRDAQAFQDSGYDKRG